MDDEDDEATGCPACGCQPWTNDDCQVCVASGMHLFEMKPGTDAATVLCVLIAHLPFCDGLHEVQEYAERAAELIGMPSPYPGD